MAPVTEVADELLGVDVVEVVAGGATTLPLLKLTAPRLVAMALALGVMLIAGMLCTGERLFVTFPFDLVLPARAFGNSGLLLTHTQFIDQCSR